MSKRHFRGALTGDVSEMRWCASHRADPAAARLADRHYNRQKIGAAQFAPTGSCVVFLSDCANAFWITSNPLAQWVKHAWAGAWINSAFRQEKAGKASELIRQAVAATRAHYGDPPPLGMVTFIDRRCRKCKKQFPKCACADPDWIVRPTMTRGTPTWGYSYRKAGFVDAGETKGGLLALQLMPNAMPSQRPANARSIHGMPLFDQARRSRAIPAKAGGGNG
jgi:hypothetical protein